MESRIREICVFSDFRTGIYRRKPNPPAAIVCGLPGRDWEENLVVGCARCENVFETAAGGLYSYSPNGVQVGSCFPAGARDFMKKQSVSTVRETFALEREKQPNTKDVFQKNEGVFHRVGLWILSNLGDKRDSEYRIALKFLEDCNNILDVGCGTGTFLSKRPDAISGVDVNPENVEYCRRQGLRAAVGDALALEFDDQVFDGVHCSHLMQVFLPDQAAQMIRELARVTRTGGKIVITTQNWFSRFYRHPENVRPYPPDAIRRYYNTRRGSVSPMYPDLPRLRQQGIRLRRPPLVELYSSTRPTLDRVSTVLNAIQYAFYLRKFWSYDAYTVLFRRE